MGLKFHGKIRLPAGKCRSGGTEINALVDGKILRGINIVFEKDILKHHFRHAAGTAAQHIFADDHIPCEVFNGSAGDEEVSRTLGELCKIDGVVPGAACVGVDGALASHEADIRLAGQKRGHGLIRAEAGYQRQVDALVGKIAVFDGNVHGSVENAVCNLVQGHFFQGPPRGGRAAGAKERKA